MFWKKKEIINQIEKYGKDTQILLDFAISTGKDSLDQITLEDIKARYEAVLASSTPYTAQSHMKALRKLFFYYRGGNILHWREITDTPLSSVVENASVQVMKEKKKETRGRPANLEMIKKVKFLIDKGGLTMRAVSRAEGIDVKTVHSWYNYPKGYKKQNLLA